LPNGNKKHDSRLPGMGGVFNTINLNAYQYAGENPVKFVDPDGRAEKKNKNSWAWRALNYITGGLWSKSTGQKADDPAAAGTAFADKMLKQTADLTVAGDIKGVVTGKNFSGKKYKGIDILIAMLPIPFIGKVKHGKNLLKSGQIGQVIIKDGKIVAYSTKYIKHSELAKAAGYKVKDVVGATVMRRADTGKVIVAPSQSVQGASEKIMRALKEFIE